MSDDAWPCQLLASAILHILTWLMIAHIRCDQVHLQVDINAHIHRDIEGVGFNMDFSVFNLIACTPSHILCLPYANFLCNSSVSGVQCQLLVAPNSRLGRFISHSLSCSLSLPQIPVAETRHSPKVLCASVLSPCRLTMVRNHMRSYHGGSHGGHPKHQTAHSVDQPLPPISPPSSQANSPPVQPCLKTLPT